MAQETNEDDTISDCFDLDHSSLGLLIQCILMTAGYVFYHFYVLHKYKDKCSGIVMTNLLNAMCIAQIVKLIPVVIEYFLYWRY